MNKLQKNTDGIIKKVYIMIPVLFSILTLLVIPFFPSQIPAHRGINFSVDRWGSRWEILIWICVYLFLNIAIYISQISTKTKQTNQGIIVAVEAIITVIYSGIIISTYYIAVSAPPIDKIMPDSDKNTTVAGIILGTLFIAFGIISFFIKRNHIIGVRTKWSLFNDTVWRHTHIFSGAICLLTGALELIMTLLKTNYLFIVILSLLCAFASILSSYYYYKKFNR